MRRIDPVAKTLEGWSRLSPAQREKFLQSGLKAAVRLGADLSFAVGFAGSIWSRAARRSGRSDGLCDFGDDMVALLKTLPRLRADDVDRGTGL